MWRFLLKTGPRVVLKLVQVSLFFPHFYSVFWACLKTQIVSHCAKIVSLQNCGDVKNEVFEKKIAFLFLSFLCWRNRNRKKKKKWKKAKNNKTVFF